MDPNVAAALVAASASLLVSLVAALVAWRSARREERLRGALPELAHLLELRGKDFEATHRAFLRSCSALQDCRDALLTLFLPAESLLSRPQADRLQKAHDRLVACYREHHPDLPREARLQLHKAKGLVAVRTPEILGSPGWESKYLNLPEEILELARETRNVLSSVQADLLLAKDIHLNRELHPG